jgi:two-component system OmpR family sensor kinase
MNTKDEAELRRAARRLAAQFAALMVVLLATVGVLVYGLVAASAAEGVRRTLQEAVHVREEQQMPPGVYVVIYRDGEVEATRALPPGLPDAAAIDHVASGSGPLAGRIERGGHTYAVRTELVGGRVVQAAVDVQESQEELQRLALALLLSGAAAAAVAAAAGVLMARRAMRPMAQALAMQRRFVADASHELRTPLTVLSTRAQLLRRRLARTEAAVTGPEEVAGAVDGIVEDARQLAEILEDLLISADPRETQSVGPVQLQAEADAAVAAQQPEAARRGLKLLRSGTRDAVSVVGSAVSLRRAITALIANALDHAGSTVRVDVQRQGRHAWLRVVDDGEGFPAGTEVRSFERFASSRAVDHGQRHYGLGLALVADIAARHGGTVRIESAAGHGATVAMELPMARTSSPADKSG